MPQFQNLNEEHEKDRKLSPTPQSGSDCGIGPLQ